MRNFCPKTPKIKKLTLELRVSKNSGKQLKKSVLEWLHDISTRNVSTPIFNPNLFNREFFNHEFFNHEFYNWIVEMFIVAKSGVENSEVVKSSSYLVGWSAITALNFSTPDFATMNISTLQL